MKKMIFLTTFVFLRCYAIYGQISTMEIPISFGANVPILTKNENSMKSVTNCDTINVQNVNVQNGGKLTLTAPTVNISADFNVHNGAEFIIRINQ